MLHLGTHMLCGKAGTQAALFTVEAMGTEWSQRGVSISTRPVSYNKPDSAGAVFQEGVRD